MKKPVDCSNGSARTGRREGVFRTPWGEGRLVLEGDRPVEIDLPRPAGPLPEPWSAAPPPEDPCSGGASADDALALWICRLEAYFSGGSRRFTAEELGLDELAVSLFARDVYRALLQIPAGETVSYGELALLAGHPGAARAVGSAMAANPLALAIPCHRVVRADGSAGRYGQCDALKPYLLTLEGAW